MNIMFKPKLPDFFVGGNTYEIEVMGEVDKSTVIQDHISGLVNRFSNGKLNFVVSMASKSVKIIVTYKTGEQKVWVRTVKMG